METQEQQLDPLTEALEERAAIMEFDGKLTRSKAEREAAKITFGE